VAVHGEVWQCPARRVVDVAGSGKAGSGAAWQGPVWHGEVFMLELRPYQQQAVDAVYRYLREHDDSPCIVIPTAGGKTPIMATICKDAVIQWGGRVLILAHIKELLQQAVDKLRLMCPEIKTGVYSAGLRRRDTEHAVIVAGIQSVYQRACELDAFDLILVDEAHLIGLDSEGMYRTFLTDAQKVNPRVRVVGLTATPFRMRTGTICGPDNILNAICYEVGVRELIVQGFLCPLITKNGINKPDTSGLHVREGEYVANEVEDLMDQDNLVEAACGEIVAYTTYRHGVLIFAAGVEHGRHIVRVLAANHGIECGFVHSETPISERDELLARFRGEAANGLFPPKPLKYLCNVNVLTTGFDAPGIDCVVLLRPTLSAGLYYQMVGRGFRLHPGKVNCLVLDFGGNVLRHGPVDQLRTKPVSAGNGEAPAKECPECRSVIAAGYVHCPECGYEFPEPERSKHEAQATNAGILSGQITTTVHIVRDELYSVHHKRGAPDDAPRTLRVDYVIGLGRTQPEFICFEHTGWARKRAERWWRARTNEPVPETAAEALFLANEGVLQATRSITVRSVAGEKYDSIVGYDFEPEGEPASAAAGGDIPF
jgi:DNA repair protein RadD